MRHILLGILVGGSVILGGCNLRHGDCGAEGCGVGQVCCLGCGGYACVAEDMCGCDDEDAGRTLDSGLGACGGPTGIACGAGMYCDALSCSGFGRCQAAPRGCRGVVDPVCGCDGATYENPCTAAQAGVVVASRGECDTAPSCGTRGLPPCRAGTYCRLDETCGAGDLGGICQPIPPGCDAVEDLVCGCDGVTYNNACLAAAAGVSVARRGSCDAPTCARQNVRVTPGCDTRYVFWDGFLCLEQTGCCEGADCGSSYSSEVECRRAHLACDRSCRGWAGSTCLPGEFCDFDGPNCDFSDAMGICRPRPTVCDGPSDTPVCGCDFVSYPDECSAHRAGTDVAIEGTCLIPG